jgi:hypothetical protein
MPDKTNQKELVSNNRLVLVSRGPKPEGWVGRYYLCPLCGYYTDRNKYDECDCGNIAIDVDYCRIIVSKSPESDVCVYDAEPEQTDSRRRK